MYALEQYDAMIRVNAVRTMMPPPRLKRALG